MAAFKLWSRKAVHDTTGTRPVVRRIAPPQRYSFARHLAFTINEDSVQMAATTHMGPKVKLLDVRKQYLTGDDGAARAQSIRHAIRGYFDEFGGPHSNVSLTLAGKETALRLLTLPRLKGAELTAAIAFEAKRQMPFSVDDCWIDHQTIEHITTGSTRQVRAAVLAVTRTAVEELLSPFRDLGIRVDHVYHTQDVVGQLLPLLSDFDSNRKYMLVDIHRQRTEISYYHGSYLQFFHVSSLGSSFLASRADATVFEYFAESLSTELQNSLDYFGGQFSGQLAHEVFVHGDLAYTDELIGLLSDRVGFKFMRFPSERLKLTKVSGSGFDAGIAACLPTVAAATNQAQIADLLPQPLRLQRQLRTINRCGISALGLVALLAVGQLALLSNHLSTAHTSLTELQSQVAAFQSSDLFGTCTRIKTQLAANRAYLQQATAKKSFLSLSLKELSLLAPTGVRLQSLEYLKEDSAGNLSMAGTVTSSSSPPEVILAEFVTNLAGSPFYQDVRVDHYVKHREDDAFVLEFNLSMKATI